VSIAERRLDGPRAELPRGPYTWLDPLWERWRETAVGRRRFKWAVGLYLKSSGISTAQIAAALGHDPRYTERSINRIRGILAALSDEEFEPLLAATRDAEADCRPPDGRGTEAMDCSDAGGV